MDVRQKLGVMGEELVAQWLEQAQGQQILYRRWRCRWGELDLIACDAPQTTASTLAFVEVKTRSSSNWDAGGLLAISPQKQIKLWKTARLFLASHPPLAALPCRFDVALVSCRFLPALTLAAETIESPIQPGKPVFKQGYQLVLQEYLVSAFEGLD